MKIGTRLQSLLEEINPRPTRSTQNSSRSKKPHCAVRTWLGSSRAPTPTKSNFYAVVRSRTKWLSSMIAPVGRWLAAAENEKNLF